MNNAWFFGDSFTAGFGYNFEEFYDPNSSTYLSNIGFSPDSSIWTDKASQFYKFNEWKESLKGYIWPKLVADKLGYICNNKGESGSNNERILHNVIRYLKDFTKGDTVFLGLTIPSRVLTPYINSPNQEGILQGSMINYDNGKPVDLIEKDEHRYAIPGELSRKEKEVILDYLFYIKIKHNEIYYRYYLERFNSIASYLESLGIKTVIWDYTYWTSYETIREYTEDRVYDGHWSINGHKDFSNLIINKLNKGENRILNSPDNTRLFNFK